MPKKTRFFRVAIEGATSDGRTIDRELLEQVAKNYDPNVYGARINLEHIRGMSPESDFRAYGDVLAVKTEEVVIGGKKKLALFAQLDVTDELVALNKKRQKLYSSLEIRPNFADTGEAYLVGLACTDNPASLGTEMLAFAAQNPNASPFKQRKDHPDDLFTVAEPMQIELEEGDDTGKLDKFMAQMKATVAKFTGKGSTDDARFAAVAETMEQMGDTFAESAGKAASHQAKTDTALAEMSAQLKELQQKFSAMDTTEQPGRRPLANGGNGNVQTDY